ncbi:hypothetical protein Bbelb_134400 [Branchiostoma belcheri]|nr:hypothetical protein Bbelb_134400 [Branchiostoma belcheri]
MTEKATFVHTDSGTRRVLQLKHATPARLVLVFGLREPPQLLTRADTQDVVFAEGSPEEPYSDLEPGAEYEFSAVQSVAANVTIPTSKPKNLRLADIQRALVCCQAVYEKTPDAVQEFLTKELTSHDFCSTSVSCYGRVSYMVAETEAKDEVFIAFRGTSSFEDVMADCSIWQQLAAAAPEGRQTAMGGRCHAGFRKLASLIPVDPFLKKYQHHRKVLCGHSLGGAVSHIVALNMLVELKRRGLKTDNIKSIAFGAPYFGDEGLRSYVEKENLSDCLLTVVNQKDPIPRILRLAEAVQTAVTTTSDKVRKFVKDVRPLLTPVLKIASSGVGGPVVAGVAAAAGTVLDQLPRAMDELDGLIQEQNVTLQELNSIYRPVGWYMFITCHEAPGSFRTTWKEGYTREERQINRFITDSGRLTPEMIHEHKAVCYATAFYNVSTRKEYDTVLTQPPVYDVVDSFAPEVWIQRNISIETAFPPHVNKVSLVSIASLEGDKDNGKLLVTIDGENLDFFILPSEDPFTGIPYDKTRREPVTVNFKSSRQVLLECYLTDGAFDPFPTITVRTHFEEIQHQTTKEEVKELKGCTLGQLAVGQLRPELLIKATQRCLATVMMMPESRRQKELRSSAMMTYLDKLDKGRHAVRNGKNPELFDMVAAALSGGLADLQDETLGPVVGEIVAEVGNHLKVTYPMGLKDWVLGTLLGLTAVAGVVVTGGAGAAYIGALAISMTGGEAIAAAVAGILASGASIFSNMKYQEFFTNVERNYKGVLKTLIEELPSVQDVNEENSIRDRALDDDVYSLESALMTKYEMLGCLDKDFDYIAKLHPFKTTWGKKLGTATKGSQQEAVRRCQMTCDLFRLRQLLMKTCFVGLIGPQDAGKTTLIKTLWGLEEVKDIGFQKHTKTAVLYKARDTERMVIVDFPGTTTVDTQVAKLVNHCGGLASFFILVMPFTGDPSKLNIDQLNNVKAFGCTFVICINQCGRFPDAFKTQENTDKFRADFSEVLDVKPSDIFFTDFVSCSPEMRAVGLMGVDDVRRWIRDWLVTYDVFEKDEPELSRAVNEQAAGKGLTSRSGFKLKTTPANLSTGRVSLWDSSKMAYVTLYGKIATLTALFLVWTSSLSVVEACPSQCACADTTVNCTNLQLLTLPANIPTDTTVLDLSYNNISVLPPDAFATLLSLTVLDLQHNNVSTVNETAFYRANVFTLSGLHTVDLSYNVLTSVPAVLQDGSLPGLLNINLQHNKITNILANAFFGVINNGLLSLDLSNNLIEEVHLEAFRGTAPVINGTLDLSFNRIKTFPVLSTLNSVITVNLEGNQITEVPEHALPNYEAFPFSVSYVYLQNNSIRLVHNNSFHPDMKVLYLHNNELRDFPGFELWRLTELENLTLNDNPWGCCDDLLEFVLYLQNNTHRLAFVNDTGFPGVECMDPLDLRGTDILSMNISHLAEDALCPVSTAVTFGCDPVMAVVCIILAILKVTGK